MKVDRLNDILCHREQRYVSEQLTMSYDRTTASRSSSSGMSYRTVWAVDMLISMSSLTASSRSDRRDTRFPIASSARTSVSATRRSSRTKDSAMR